MTKFATNDQPLRAQNESDGLQALHQFISILHNMGEHNAYVKYAFEESSESKRAGRTLVEVAMDDLMDAFAYIVKDVKDGSRIATPYYLMAMRARYGNEVTPDDAQTNMEARAAQYRKAPLVPAKMPDYIELVHMQASDNINQNLVHLWQQTLNNISALMMDETALAARQNYLNLTNGFNAAVQQAVAAKAAFGNVLSEVKNLDEDQAPLKAKNSAKTGATKPSTSTALAVVDHTPANIEERTSQEIAKQNEIATLRIKQQEIRKRLEELGVKGANNVETLRERLTAKDLPDEIRTIVNEELEQLEEAGKSQEGQKIANYLKWVADLPWNEFSEVEKDINKTETVLNASHYGMDKVKEAIIEHVAVENRTGEEAGKIICLVGPPGVGKTSIGRSVAESTSREFVRISLGGVQNESAIRGHGRTYLGSRPGKIVEALKKAGTNNPIMQLDEIDKMSVGGANGDPTAAMLEVLDPAQNHAFEDHYLGVPLDLSKTMFIATANNLGAIPGPLRDRMQIIALNGYTHEEKLEIAKRYLITKQMVKNGLTDQDLTIDRSALDKIVNNYTREAGVRNLERTIGQICAKVATKIEKGEITSANVTAENISDYLGRTKITRKDVQADGDQIGIVNGLAYSTVGGSIMRIEATKRMGQNFNLQVTGNLHKVMAESTQVARTYILANTDKFGLTRENLKGIDVHLHALSAAVPKDGPSAGAAMVTVLLSAIKEIPIRCNVAMTGEVTAHGQVKAIGGLPEKLDGAVQDGADTVLIPKENEKDLEDVPQSVLDQLTIIPVSTMDEVLAHVLTEKIEPVAPEADAKNSEEPEVTIVEEGPIDDDTPEPEADDKNPDAEGAALTPVFRTARNPAVAARKDRVSNDNGGAAPALPTSKGPAGLA